MNNKITNYLNMAAKIAVSKNDERSFYLGAVAIRNDGAIVKTMNAPSQYPDRFAHAEHKICRKAGFGSIVYVARVAKGTKELAMAKPCGSCSLMLKAFRVDKVYYTIGPEHYGIWDPIKNTDKIIFVGSE